MEIPVHSKHLKFFLLTVFAGALLREAQAADSASFEAGAGNRTDMVRFGVQWKWDRQWWQSNGTHIGGYWDASVFLLRGSEHRGIRGNTQKLWAVGITPVWRLQSDTRMGFYVEAGVGLHLLSGLYDNAGRQLSTRPQFGDHLGVGYVFRNNWDLGLKLQHFSNGGFKKPNDGVNLATIRLIHTF